MMDGWPAGWVDDDIAERAEWARIVVVDHTLVVDAAMLKDGTRLIRLRWESPDDVGGALFMRNAPPAFTPEAGLWREIPDGDLGGAIRRVWSSVLTESMA